MDLGSTSQLDSDIGELRQQVQALHDDSAALRRHARHDFDRPIWVYSGEMSEETKIRGICRDLSQSGLGAILESAPAVGEEMWLVLEDFEPVEDPIHARCMRARVLPISGFEVGFLFVSSIELPAEFL